MKTKQLAACSMLAAMCAVLGYVAVETNAFKLTFESLPVFVAALMFGPAEGILVGGVGTFIYQLLRYGLSVTTALWILPYVIAGGLMGLYASKKGFKLSSGQYLFIVMACELLITVLNTGCIYVDSHIYGYYHPALIFGSLAMRLAVCLVKGFAFGVIIPRLIMRIKRA